MRQENKRTGWIDICKALAIYCMVLGHTGTSRQISTVIHVFHMPVFFVLSGYCFNEIKNSNMLAFIKKRFLTLIVPYFIFGITLFMFWDAALFVLHRKEEMRSISNLMTSILWNNANASAFGVIQWFLPCLFFSEIIFGALLKISKNIFYLSGGILFLSICGYLIPLALEMRLPWALDCALMATAFYALGWISKKTLILEKISELIKNRRAICWFIIIVVSIAMLPSVFYNGAVNMRTVTYGNYFLYIVNAVVYSFLIILVSMLLEQMLNHNAVCDMLERIGRNTLVVLLLNSTCVRVYEVLFGSLLEKFSETVVFVVNGIVAVIITIACVLMSEFINKYCPCLIGKRKVLNCGERNSNTI